jgi:hypothetical protein
VLLSGDSHEPHWQFDVMADVTRRLGEQGVASRLLASADPKEVVALLTETGSASDPSSTMVAAARPRFHQDRPAGSSVGIAPGVSHGHGAGFPTQTLQSWGPPPIGIDPSGHERE